MESGMSCGLCACRFSWLAFKVKVRAEALYSGVSFTTGVPACRQSRHDVGAWAKRLWCWAAALRYEHWKG